MVLSPTRLAPTSSNKNASTVARYKAVGAFVASCYLSLNKVVGGLRVPSLPQIVQTLASEC